MITGGEEDLAATSCHHPPADQAGNNMGWYGEWKQAGDGREGNGGEELIS
jgi:hypothetical protein